MDDRPERGATSPPVIMNFEGLADRVEYLHSESKGFFSAQSNVNQAIDRRVAKLEFLSDQTGERLNGGAQTFSKLEQQIEKVNAKIEGPIWKTVVKVIGFAAPTVMFALHLTWQAAKMPDEGKFEVLKSDVLEQKLQLVRQEGALSNIQASVDVQARLTAEQSRKLDALLLRQSLPTPSPSSPSSAGTP